MILGCPCNLIGLGARGKLSPIPVDKFGGKFQGMAKFPCFYVGSLICLIFGRYFNILKINDKFIGCLQNIENKQLFVTFR
jgi:hypothetical protein